jgi:hypothetical protein
MCVNSLVYSVVNWTASDEYSNFGEKRKGDYMNSISFSFISLLRNGKCRYNRLALDKLRYFRR